MAAAAQILMLSGVLAGAAGVVVSALYLFWNLRAQKRIARKLAVELNRMSKTESKQLIDAIAQRNPTQKQIDLMQEMVKKIAETELEEIDRKQLLENIYEGRPRYILALFGKALKFQGSF